jgi:septum site-determining protein MinD
MTRIIACVSGKGGAGKTTLVANLGVALAKMGINTVVVDTNITTPNLGLHLGVPFYPITLHDVLKGTARIKEAVYEHETGLRIIPAGISLRDLKGTDPKQLPNTLLDLLGDADIILLDVAAGLGREALSAMESADEIILITNPEVTAVTDALKAAKLAQQIGTKISGVVVNKVTKEKHEMKMDDILSMLGDYNLLSVVPEDIHVQKAIASRSPVVHYKPGSPASKEIRRLAMRVAGSNYRFFEYKQPWHSKVFSFLR